MKLAKLQLRNYRTIEALDIEFPGSYAAICGPNDSGKTNVIRAIRAVMQSEDEGRIYPGDEDAISAKDDFPKWLNVPEEQQAIEVSLTLEISSERDTGIFQFLLRQLKLDGERPNLCVTLKATYGDEKTGPGFSVFCDGQLFEGIEAQEVFKRFRTSRSILFHDSPQNELVRMRFREGFGLLREISGEGATVLARLKKDMERGLRKIAKAEQQELERLLGRLETKYSVGLSIHALDLGWLPFNLTLGDSKHAVPLNNWGSGTLHFPKNQVLMLSMLSR